MAAGRIQRPARGLRLDDRKLERGTAATSVGGVAGTAAPDRQPNLYAPDSWILCEAFFRPPGLQPFSQDRKATAGSQLRSAVLPEARPDAVGALEKRRLLRQTDDEPGRGRLPEGRVVEGASGFCFRSRGRVFISVRRVQAQNVAGLLGAGLQSNVSERLARRSSRGCDVNHESADG